MEKVSSQSPKAPSQDNSSPPPSKTTGNSRSNQDNQVRKPVETDRNPPQTGREIPQNNQTQGRGSNQKFQGIGTLLDHRA